MKQLGECYFKPRHLLQGKAIQCGHASDSAANPYAKPALSHLGRGFICIGTGGQDKRVRLSGVRLNQRALKPINSVCSDLGEVDRKEVQISVCEASYSAGNLDFDIFHGID